MDKQTMVYSYKGILLNHEKEWSADTSYNPGDPWNHYATGMEPDTKGHVLCDSIDMKSLEQAEP